MQGSLSLNLLWASRWLMAIEEPVGSPVNWFCPSVVEF